MIKMGDVLTIEEFPFKCGGWSSYKEISDYEKSYGNKFKLKILIQIKCYEQRFTGEHFKTFLKVVGLK